MMRRRTIHSTRNCISAAAVLLLTATALAQTLPQDFKDRSFRHVVHLAGLGGRVAGTPGEAEAIRYVKEQFEKSGLTASVEPFEVQSYELEKATLELGGEETRITRLAFDPYAGASEFSGEAVFVDPGVLRDREQFRQLKIENKLAITTGEARALFLLMFMKPRLVAFVSQEDFENLRAKAPAPAKITANGRLIRVKSANVVASLAPETNVEKEVILSAHLDSYNCPGASDNASGVAVLLELADHFARRGRSLPFRLQFLALGAEEVGMVGARAYLNRHLGELRHCALLFNMDSVGGSGRIFVEMLGGVRGVPPETGDPLPEELRDKASNDVDGTWRLMRFEALSMFEASNVPDWLQNAIRETASEVGYEIVPARSMGSDHRVFAQAGIAATNIAISGTATHSPEDVPERVSKESLEKTARLVLGVVEKVP